MLSHQQRKLAYHLAATVQDRFASSFGSCILEALDLSSEPYPHPRFLDGKYYLFLEMRLLVAVSQKDRLGKRWKRRPGRRITTERAVVMLHHSECCIRLAMLDAHLMEDMKTCLG